MQVPQQSMQYAALCCSVLLQCDALCCSVPQLLQTVAVCRRQPVAGCCWRKQQLAIGSSEDAKAILIDILCQQLLRGVVSRRLCSCCTCVLLLEDAWR